MPSRFSDRPPLSTKILILEPDAEGHPQELLQHLADFAAEDTGATEITIAAPPSMCAAISRSMPTATEDRVRFIALEPSELKFCTHRSLLVAAFARWWTMRRYLARSGADFGFFLSMDLVCVPLALGLSTRGKPVSGILFRPSVHYGMLGNYRPSWIEKLRDLRKDLLYRLMLRNPSLQSVLSYDSFFPAHAAAHYSHGAKVQALPDPAHPVAATTAQPSSAAVDFVPPGRVGLLLFGYLSERKGPLVVLDALKLLPSHIAARAAVLFAGRVDPAIRDAIDSRCAALAQTQPELWLRVDDRRLDQGEIEVLVARSDVVLVTYQRFVGSSGVLLRAARVGRPVLAQEYGLVGRLTRDHRLGAVADTSDPVSLAREIEHMIVSGPQSFIDLSSATNFASSCTPHRFASIIVGTFRGAKNAPLPEGERAVA